VREWARERERVRASHTGRMSERVTDRVRENERVRVRVEWERERDRESESEWERVTQVEWVRVSYTGRVSESELQVEWVSVRTEEK